MTRIRGRAKRGERCRAAVPHGHWNTTTLTAGFRLGGIVAPMLLPGPMDGGAFRAYVRHVLVPELSPGDIAVMDNLPAHKVTGIREMIEDARAGLLLPAAVLARLQPDRTRLLQAQGIPAKSGSENQG
jgi:hypothetical protein